MLIAPSNVRGRRPRRGGTAKRRPAQQPLCVDLDGTLLMGDLLAESAWSAIRRRWLTALAIPGWLLRGRAVLKARLAERAAIDVATLPYNRDLLAMLEEERRQGRRLVLVTACDRRLAEAVAAHLGLFDEVMASDGATNLKGAAKAAALDRRFGAGGYVYAGNDRADIPVWREASSAIVVNAGAGVVRAAQAIARVDGELPRRQSRLAALVRALRPHQWVKNALIFVAPAMAHALLEPAVALAAIWTFLGFCLAASGVYVVNDLMDLEADRRHARKRLRPFASGALPLAYGAAGPLLIAGGIGIAAAVSLDAALLIVLYALLSTAYSLHLKQLPLVDVFMLAALYSLRLFAGGVASGHAVSIWLLNFSGFLFLGLACLKRQAEMRAVGEGGLDGPGRRGYLADDAPVLQIMGIASSFVSALVLSLYVNSTVALETYSSPVLLWLVVPLVLFWQCRLWLATSRGEMNDDPILYSARDPASWSAFLLVGAAFALATLGFPDFV